VLLAFFRCIPLSLQRLLVGRQSPFLRHKTSVVPSPPEYKPLCILCFCYTFSIPSLIFPPIPGDTFFFRFHMVGPHSGYIALQALVSNGRTVPKDSLFPLFPLPGSWVIRLTPTLFPSFEFDSLYFFDHCPLINPLWNTTTRFFFLAFSPRHKTRVYSSSLFPLHGIKSAPTTPVLWIFPVHLSHQIRPLSPRRSFVRTFSRLRPLFFFPPTVFCPDFRAVLLIALARNFFLHLSLHFCFRSFRCRPLPHSSLLSPLAFFFFFKNFSTHCLRCFLSL